MHLYLVRLASAPDSYFQVYSVPKLSLRTKCDILDWEIHTAVVVTPYRVAQLDYEGPE